ncbi:hypothetical protein CDEST_15613 [Colletotrichum destructivum]|uniref:Uncharacterized protein n=1 Tax=Colletotrichum destructivum TaxID=34406 RepID=A0AAX4J4S2_9PEZI|nr:hypothetical protein CDEST_15613 [Colletotrichum destructivum]
MFSLPRRCPQTQRLLSRSWTPVLATYSGQLPWKPILDASSGQTTVLENSTAGFRFYSMHTRGYLDKTANQVHVDTGSYGSDQLVSLNP